MRYAVAQNHPPVLPPALPRPRPRDVHDLVAAEPVAVLRAENSEGAASRIEGEDAPLGTRRVLESAEREEKDGAERDPQEGDDGKAATHGSL